MSEQLPAHNHDDLEQLLRKRIDAQRATGVPLLDDLAESAPEPTPEFTRELEGFLMQHWHEHYNDSARETPMTYESTLKRKNFALRKNDDSNRLNRREGRFSLAGAALLILLIIGTGGASVLLMSMGWRDSTVGYLYGDPNQFGQSIIQPERTNEPTPRVFLEPGLQATRMTPEPFSQAMTEVPNDPNSLAQAATDIVATVTQESIDLTPTAVPQVAQPLPTDPDSFVQAATDIVATVTQESIDLTSTALSGFGLPTATPLASGLTEATPTPVQSQPLPTDPDSLVQAATDIIGTVTQETIDLTATAQTGFTVPTATAVPFMGDYSAYGPSPVEIPANWLTMSLPMPLIESTDGRVVQGGVVRLINQTTGRVIADMALVVDQREDPSRQFSQLYFAIPANDAGYFAQAIAAPNLVQIEVLSESDLVPVIAASADLSAGAILTADVLIETYYPLVHAPNAYHSIDEAVGRTLRHDTPLGSPIINDVQANVPAGTTFLPTATPVGATVQTGRPCMLSVAVANGVLMRVNPSDYAKSTHLIPKDTELLLIESQQGSDDGLVWYHVQALYDDGPLRLGWVRAIDTVATPNECPSLSVSNVLPTAVDPIIQGATDMVSTATAAAAVLGQPFTATPVPGGSAVIEPMFQAATDIILTATQVAIDLAQAPTLPPTLLAAVTPVSASEPLCHIVAIEPAGVILRARPTVDSQLVGSVPSNTVMSALEQTRNDSDMMLWYRVQVTVDQAELNGWAREDVVVPQTGEMCPELPMPTATPIAQVDLDAMATLIVATITQQALDFTATPVSDSAAVVISTATPVGNGLPTVPPLERTATPVAESDIPADTLVVVARQAILRGMVLSPEMLETRLIPLAESPESYFYDLNEVLGQIATVDIAQGSPVIRSTVIESPFSLGENIGSVSTIVPESSEEPINTATPVIAQTKPVCTVLVSDTQDLDLHEEASTTSPLVSIIPRGMSVKLLDKQVGDDGRLWYHLQPRLGDVEFNGWGQAEKTTILPGYETICPNMPELLPMNYIAYIVRPGDTIEKLVNEYGTSAEIIRDVNGMTDEQVQNLQPDQAIIIPLGVPSGTTIPFITATPFGDGLPAIAPLEGTPTPLAISTALPAGSSASVANGCVLVSRDNASLTVYRNTVDTQESIIGSIPAATPMELLDRRIGITGHDLWYSVRAQVDGAKVEGWINAESTTPQSGYESICPYLPAQRGFSTFHFVEAGETPLSIAAYHGIDIDDLLTTNNLTGDETLEVGQLLFISYPLPICRVTVVNAQGSFLRERPSIYAPQIDILLADTAVTVIEQALSADDASLWYRVQATLSASTVDGWIEASSVAQDSEFACPATLPEMTVTPEVLCRAVVADLDGAGIPLFTEPSADSEQTAVIPPSAPLEVIEQMQVFDPDQVITWWNRVRVLIDGAELVGWVDAQQVLIEGIPYCASRMSESRENDLFPTAVNPAVTSTPFAPTIPLEGTSTPVRDASAAVAGTATPVAASENTADSTADLPAGWVEVIIPLGQINITRQVEGDHSFEIGSVVRATNINGEVVSETGLLTNMTYGTNQFDVTDFTVAFPPADMVAVSGALASPDYINLEVVGQNATAPVVVASQAISTGMSLSFGMLETHFFPLNELPESYFYNYREALGKITTIDIAPAEPIIKNAITEGSSLDNPGSDSTVQFPEGWRAFSIPMSRLVTRLGTEQEHMLVAGSVIRLVRGEGNEVLAETALVLDVTRTTNEGQDDFTLSVAAPAQEAMSVIAALDTQFSLSMIILSENRTAPVVVARNDILAGTTLTFEMLETVYYPVDALPVPYYRDFKETIGKVTSADTVEGDPIVNDTLEGERLGGPILDRYDTPTATPVENFVIMITVTPPPTSTPLADATIPPVDGTPTPTFTMTPTLLP